MTYVPCTFIVHSGAHRTHLTRPTQHMRKTSTQSHTYTGANTRHKCTHNGKTTIITNRSIQHKLAAVANPAISTNRISVHDITRLPGNVLFTPSQAVINRNSKYQTTHPILGTAPRNGTHEAYTWTNRNMKHSYSARTKPYQNQQTKSVSTKTKNTTTVTIVAPRTPKIHARRQLSPHISQIYNPAANTKRFHTQGPQETRYLYLQLNHATAGNFCQMSKSRSIPTMSRHLAEDSKTIIWSACPVAQKRRAPHRKTTYDYKPGQYLSPDTCGPIFAHPQAAALRT